MSETQSILEAASRTASSESRPVLKTAQAVFRALEDGESLSDEEFDRIYPDGLQMVSETHWTPVEIAKRAARLLVVDSTTAFWT